MKKLFITFLCLIMVAVFMPTMVFAAVDDTDVAKIGDTGYDTLQDAVDNAAEGDIVVLLKPVNSSVEVKAGTKVTLNLNGNDIITSNAHAIANHGDLTITGAGNVKCQSGSKAALANYPGAKAVLNGGTYNSEGWYTIKNLGTMTINEGTTVQAATGGSSLIDTGWYGNTGNDLGLTTDGKEVRLDINGGVFSGGMNTVKNDDYGVLNISGGSFTNSSGPTILNWNEANISGGTFEATTGHVIAVGSYDNEADKGILNITGGDFISGNDGADALFGVGEGGTPTAAKLNIDGGEFVGQAIAGVYEIKVTNGGFVGTIDENVNVVGDRAVIYVDDMKIAEVVGNESINAILDELANGEVALTPEELALVTVEITKAAADSKFEVPVGMTVKNSTEGKISVNDANVDAGKEITVEAPKEDPQKPNTDEPKEPDTDKPNTDKPDADKQDDKEATKEPVKDVSKTGDETTVLPWIALMMLAAGAAAALKRKEN